MFTAGVFAIQGLILLVLGVAALAVDIWALVEAARFRKDAYLAAGKQTKPIWLAITIVASLLALLFVQNPITSGGSFLGIIGDAACIVFLVSVRPALRQVSGRGGRSSGPYGGW